MVMRARDNTVHLTTIRSWKERGRPARKIPLCMRVGRPMPHSCDETTRLEHGAEGAFGVRRLVASLKVRPAGATRQLAAWNTTNRFPAVLTGVPISKGGKPPGTAADQRPLAATSRRTPERPSSANSVGP
jgi:hypothetical protein